jgi:hypothetical protein
MSHGIHLHMTTETHQKGRLRLSCKIMSGLVYEIMIPDLVWWNTPSPVERADTMACLNPRINVFLVYNTFNFILAVHKKVKCKLCVF